MGEHGEGGENANPSHGQNASTASSSSSSQPRKFWLSEPLFTWDPSREEEGVSLDELHKRLIHRREGGFLAVDLFEGDVRPDALSVQCGLRGLQRIRFSPDGLYFAYLQEDRHVGVMHTLNAGRQGLKLAFKWSHRPDFEVLDLFWLDNPNASEYIDLVVIANYGLEVMRIMLDQFLPKSVKTFSTPARLCWVEPTTSMVVVCTSSRTLQPFDFSDGKISKLAKFDLVLGRGQVLELEEVAVLPLYDDTYCVHADSLNGRVSLRNISNPQKGTPQHDIVIDVTDEDSVVGKLRLSKVDNLLVVHCLQRKVSVLFDIHHRDRGTVPCVAGPWPISAAGTDGYATPLKDTYLFFNGPWIMDKEGGALFQLKVDMRYILQDFLTRTSNDLAAVMRFLLRRSNCRPLIVDTLERALNENPRPSVQAWSQVFIVLNQAYRQAIEELSGRRNSVPLSELEEQISHRSIVSENHMVSKVFYPYFLSTLTDEGRSKHEAAIAVESGSRAPWDLCRIPMPTSSTTGTDPTCNNNTTEDNKSTCSPENAADATARLDQSPPAEAAPATATTAATTTAKPGRTPYLLSVVILYLRCLLRTQIFPHKILQCFVVDLCLYYSQENVLQQFLHHHVLSDSPELLERIKQVAETRNYPWAVQVCFDMALRTKQSMVVADMLLHTRQYTDVIPFLLNQQLYGFKLCRLLEHVEADADANAQDPELMNHLVAEVRAWRDEAVASSRLDALPAEVMVPPTLDGCERWLPEMIQPEMTA